MLLINPPFCTNLADAITPPLGLGYIASYLRSRGFSCEILDCPALRMGDPALRGFLARRGDCIVGISSSTPAIHSALRAAEIVKEVMPSAMVVLGGPHLTALPAETLSAAPSVDVVVMGEGEFTMHDLAIRAGRPDSAIDDVGGVVYRAAGAIRRTEPRELIADLDALPFPAFDMLPMGRYRPSIKWYYRTPIATMITSRGCPFNCIFCDSHLTFGRKTRFRSPANVIEEIRLLMRDFGVREITFYDDTFTLNKARVHEICDRMLAEGMDLTWGCLSRVDTLDRDLLGKMKKAGCHMLSFGVESGSETMLRRMRKGITPEESFRAIRLAREMGMDCNASIVLGIPGETVETMRETLDFILRANPTYALFFRLVPFPGTELYEEYLRQNPSARNRFDTFADVTNAPLLTLDSITPRDFARMSRRMYLSFYLRPRKIGEYLRQITSPHRLKGYLRALGTFLRVGS